MSHKFRLREVRRGYGRGRVDLKLPLFLSRQLTRMKFKFESLEDLLPKCREGSLDIVREGRGVRIDYSSLERRVKSSFLFVTLLSKMFEGTWT